MSIGTFFKKWHKQRLDKNKAIEKKLKDRGIISDYCCEVFERFVENRDKKGLSILVDYSKYDKTKEPYFWLQMRAVDTNQQSSLPKGNSYPCNITLWTETRVLYCPWCGKKLKKFYRRNWETLFAPIHEHSEIYEKDAEKIREGNSE